jgi:heptaprenyl diphosphate synthase
VDNAAGLLGLPHLDDDLVRLEAALRRAVSSEDPFLAEVATHLIAAGGKRLRPVLSDQDVLEGGVAVELVHLGSLYHDDVIDEAATRRGVESVNARWGNLIAIVAGDFLLARASEIAARLGSEVAALLAATIGRLCEGQVLELKAAFDTTRVEEAYFASIAGKTAALMAASCRIGALVARLPPRQVEALTAFGRAFGMVFQIRDDVLDVVAEEAELGKPAGQDLVEGVYTLPVIRALADPAVGPALGDLLGRPLGPAERDRARDLVRGSGAAPAAVGVARRFADEAAGALGVLDPSPVVDGLARLGHHLLDGVTPAL